MASCLLFPKIYRRLVLIVRTLIVIYAQQVFQFAKSVLLAIIQHSMGHANRAKLLQ